MRIGRVGLCGLVLAIALLCVPSVALGALKGRIYEGKGIKAARLGMKDSKAAKKIGGKHKVHRDDDYDYPVWLYSWGSKTSGKYPLEMYSKGSHKVFEFIINGTKLKTKNGSKVGTKEATLVDRYGSKLTKDVGPVYTDYHMGPRTGRTDFWVRDGKVRQIVISKY